MGPTGRASCPRRGCPRELFPYLRPVVDRESSHGGAAPVTPLPAPPSLVHRLVHGARRIDVGINPDVDERRDAGLDRLAAALERRTDLPRIAHLFAVAPEHLGELRERHVAELVADVAALGAVLGDLAVADLVHRRVVADDAEE